MIPDKKSDNVKILPLPPPKGDFIDKLEFF
jgi:hypothetical protein